MQAKEFRDFSDVELATKEQELQESLMALRLRHRTSQLESPARLQQARRDIARLRTVQRERRSAQGRP